MSKRSNGKKRQNGLTSDKVQELRRAMRILAKTMGAAAIASAVGQETLEEALATVHVDMLKADFGSANNAMKKLSKPEKPSGNKYAHLKGRTKSDRAPA